MLCFNISTIKICLCWGIEPGTFEFERENRTNCAIKTEKNVFPDFYRKNTQIYVIFKLFFACRAVNSMIGAWVEVKLWWERVIFCILTGIFNIYSVRNDLIELSSL